MNAFARVLMDHVTRYVQLRRTLGHSFDTQASTLQAFAEFVKRSAQTGPLTQQLALTFVLGCPVTPNIRARRYAILRNFADYFSVFDPRTEALDPRALPRSRAIPPARILESSELDRLLEAARAVSPHHAIRGQTLYTVIGLLASTGLRSGEIAHLDRSDVDLHHGVLRIRRTKFRKDRLVPVHETTLNVLRTYVAARDRAYAGATSPAFFLSLRGERWTATGIRSAFRQACAKAGLDTENRVDLRCAISTEMSCSVSLNTSSDSATMDPARETRA
jgi:integrase